MKFILSRKGFDSQFGGHPSPVFEDGTMLSLPVPEIDGKGEAHDTGCKFCELNFPKFKVNACFCHLDPDIRPELYKKQPMNWVPALGQGGAAASHLMSNHIGAEDVFLFFGLFRKWGRQSGYVGTPFHAIWGYMQIAEVINLSEHPEEKANYPWHPHTKDYLLGDGKIDRRPGHVPNLLYIGRKTLTFKNEIPGYGSFRFTEVSKPGLLLSIPDQKYLTHWRYEALPWTKGGYANMTYHRDSNCCESYFQAASRGQEFVISENQSESTLERFETLLQYNMI